MPFQYPYSHSTYFTRTESQERTSELPPMNSAEDVAQIRFMHDRMMFQDEDSDISGKSLGWSTIARITKDLRKTFRFSAQVTQTGKQQRNDKKRMSVISTWSTKEESRIVIA
ncbi:hypothetical protein FA15DRAFT_668483 [Coprinopsis marcescibilis]|uniref:Uncharacterized protein n=1 Tax=Coprinopsis marcescibilis TaxID=230819 RepID=A0A5C3KYY4_COPMA|nr:hypothetical protein FA15DRAFT_668483 [Coprinopsis marcescibilis]